jgi:hypothetical protein
VRLEGWSLCLAKTSFKLYGQRSLDVRILSSQAGKIRDPVIRSLLQYFARLACRRGSFVEDAVATSAHA